MVLAFRSNTILIQSTANAACDIGAPASIADDDILIFVIDRAVVTGAIVWPTDFVELWTADYGGDGNLAAAWKRASSESGTYNATWTGNSRNVGIMYAISGADTSGNPTTVGTAATGTTASPDPPSADPGSSAARLAIAVYGCERKADSFTQPSGYTEPSSSDGSTSGGGAQGQHSTLGLSHRTYTGQAENPGTAAIVSTSSADWAAQTIVFDPAITGVSGDAALIGKEQNPLGIPIHEVGVIPDYKIILTNPKNLIVGIRSQIKLRKAVADRTAIATDTRFYMATIREDFAIEEYDAISICEEFDFDWA